MKKYLFWSLLALCLLIVGLVGYGSYLNYAGEHHLLERMGDRRIPVKGERAVRRDMKIIHQMPTVTFYSDDMADAKALVKGHIVKIHVRKNDFVEAGTPICTLMDEELPVKIKKSESDIMSAESQLTIAQNDYERYERLYQKEGTSQSKVDEKMSTYLSAQSKLDELYANRDLLMVQDMRQEVKAPISGEVLLLYQQEGAYVDAGTPIVLMGNFDELFCALILDEPAMEGLTMDTQVQIKFQPEDLAKAYDTLYSVAEHVNLADNLTDGILLNASVAQAYPDFSEPASVRKVIWRIDNRAGVLEPKTYGATQWISGKTQKRLSIPRYALLEPNKNMAPYKNTVFVLLEDGTLEERKVTTGIRDDNYVEIISGLEEGEMVITSFPEGLASGTKVVLIDAEGGS